MSWVKLLPASLPESLLATLNDPLIKGSAQVMGSPRVFSKHGESGLEFSDYLPHLARPLACKRMIYAEARKRR